MGKLEELQAKWGALKEERHAWEEEYEEISRLIFPRRDTWQRDDGQPTTKDRTVYDGTPIGALNLLANGLVGYLVSPSYPWFKLRIPLDQGSEIPGARQWLETCEQILYQNFHQSNFYEEIVETFKDGGATGFGTIFEEEDPARSVPVFHSVHNKEVFIAENAQGRIDTTFREFHTTARNAVQRFGEENVSDRTRELAETHPYERVRVVHSVYPRTDRDVTKIDAKNKKYASIYFEPDAGVVLNESGFDEARYHHLRWSTNSDEVYPRGPGYDALTDAKKSNAISKAMLKAAELSVNPPVNVPNDMLRRIKLSPGARNPYSPSGGRTEPIQMVGNYPIGRDREQALQQIIEQHFMVDFFLMLQRAPEGMTATEVMERQSEKAAVLGTVIGRISSELLDPVIKTTFKLAGKAGQIPDPPPALVEALEESGRKMQIEYVGALAQAQRRFYATRGMQQGLQAFMPLMEAHPALQDLINWDQAGRHLLEEYGVPADIIRDKDQLRQIRMRRQQARQQQQQQQQQMEAAEAYQNLKEAPQQGSPVSEIGKQMKQALQRGGA